MVKKTKKAVYIFFLIIAFLLLFALNAMLLANNKSDNIFYADTLYYDADENFCFDTKELMKKIYLTKTDTLTVSIRNSDSCSNYIVEKLVFEYASLNNKNIIFDMGNYKWKYFYTQKIDYDVNLKINYKEMENGIFSQIVDDNVNNLELFINVKPLFAVTDLVNIFSNESLIAKNKEINADGFIYVNPTQSFYITKSNSASMIKAEDVFITEYPKTSDNTISIFACILVSAISVIAIITCLIIGKEDKKEWVK